MIKSAIYSTIISSIIMIQCVESLCAAESPETQRLIQLGIIEPPGSYVYNIEGRLDPFKPFISLQALAPNTPDQNEILDNNNDLTGMQLFEPGQLTLVGVLVSEARELAFVEDQSKKGYILKVGTLVGKRGRVTQILSDKVFIEEIAKTRSGQEIKSMVVLKMNKEGEK